MLKQRFDRPLVGSILGRLTPNMSAGILTVCAIYLMHQGVFAEVTEVLNDPVDLDRTRLERIEDLSESLANALLDFSVAARNRNVTHLGAFFPEQILASLWPLEEATQEEQIKSILHQTRNPTELAPREAVYSDYLLNWTLFLDRFSEIEDVRFKVKDAEFITDGEISARNAGIKFFLVGRNVAGKRYWVKGTGHLDARLDGTQWKITRFSTDSLDEYSCSVDLFSEVSTPANLAVPLPPYGTPGNDDFIYHGAAAGDPDQNGLIDLLVTGINGIVLYRNRGDGTFSRVSEAIGLPPVSNATAPIFLDYDADGDRDLFISAVGTQLLFENRLIPDGEMRFEDHSIESGVSRSANGFSVTAGDVNKDGWTDLYVASYNRFGQVMPNSWHNATNGTSNLLFINQGDGTFREAAEEWGVRDTRWSYSAQFLDVNRDGRLDLYVANDFGENGLYVNQGGRFEDQASELGVIDAGNGMGVSAGDFDNDGRLDLFVTNMSSTAGNRILNRLVPGTEPSDNVLRKLAAGSTLFRANPAGGFEDVTSQFGPFSGGWAWGGVFTDFDNDGWQDLYHTNGFVSGKSMKDT